ncbi:alpha-mannosidase [Mediterraneibacter gnavus]|uniref:alpha-mannosidase n=1 Tax=Mediterraneibacter gnavus TaxID=33038 RepID=UPI00232DB1B7|nr:glycoside hydrolase family 38 C-terminal domain-containing protein [Mediterraneibacter gnavus]MDB8711097.1 glycoside hydrolase family 38 C-terminal domain-containing protein [Mediterraneibacter gnavus]MDB8714463.1 glycoside hydrolase family 38 C-terminal domain-containing protein [Mediterraneibacter gnavus]
MNEKKTNYIIPHTHWDREWRYPIWKNRMLLIRFMDELLETLDKHENYSCFLMDGQVAPIDDYLEVKPENKEKVEKYIKAGRIAVGPWYTLPDLYPLDGECLVRNLLKGIRASEKHGGCMKVGYNSFGWGQTAQFPQLYDKFGINFIICAKKVSHERAPESEFMWEGPDGTRVLTTRLGANARANFYFYTYLYGKYGVNCLSSEFSYRPELSGMAVHNADSGHMDEDFFMVDSKMDYHKEWLHKGFTDTEKGTEDTVAKNDRLYLDGTDFSTPHPELTDMIRDLKEVFPNEEFVNTRLEVYAERMHEVLDKDSLRTVFGELRDGPSCDCSGNALASRMYLKLLNKKAENLLIRKAEPFMAVNKLLGNGYEDGYLKKAWDYLIKSHPHDSINGVTQDKTADDVEYRLNQAIEMGQVLCDEAAYAVIRDLDLGGEYAGKQAVVVFNPQPFEVEEICKVMVTTPKEENVWSMTAHDIHGNELKVQEISRDEKDFPVHDLEARPWPFAADRHLMYLETGKIPAMGYKVIIMEPASTFSRTHYYWMEMRKSEGHDICATDNVLENENLKVTVNFNGTVNMFDKNTGETYENLHYFEDAGDVGNYWAYYPPYHNQIHTTLTNAADVWCEDNGPLSATIAIRYHMQLPAKGYESKCGVRGEGKRSGETKEFTILSYLTLEKGAKSLKVRTVVENNVENHRLRVAFPTGIQAETVDTAGHFVVDRRPAHPVKDKDGRFYPEMRTLPMQMFADVSDGKKGLGIVNNCFTEYEMKDDQTLYFTLFRSMGNMIVTWWEAVGEFPGKMGSQLLRKMEFEYAIYPHKGNWEEAQTYAEARRLNAPVMAYQVLGGKEGKLPPEQGFLNVQDKNLQVSAFKKAEDSENIILRVYNPTGKTISSQISIDVPGTDIREVAECNLNEERSEKTCEVQDNSWAAEVKKNEIKTYVIVLR